MCASDAFNFVDLSLLTEIVLKSIHCHIHGRYSGFLPKQDTICGSLKERLTEYFYLVDMKGKLRLLLSLCSDIAAGMLISEHFMHVTLTFQIL